MSVGLLMAVLLLSFVGGGNCADAQKEALERFVYRQGHMGMEVRLVLYAPDRVMSEQAARAAFDQVEHLDSLLSSYRSDSELMRVNRQAGQGPVSVGYHLFSVLKRGQALARQSEGAMDVTAGALIQLWREARRTGQLPDSTVLQAARRRVGWQHLSLNANDQTVAFGREGMELVLGGLAKGYILEETLEVLVEHGVSHALVEAGGDLVTGAPPPGKEGWAVDVPHSLSGDSSSVITVAHSAVATSGDGVQYVEIGGTRYSHVINPRTGLGLTNQPTTTVVAPDGLVADAVATTVGVVGPEKGASFVRTHHPGATVYVTVDDSTRILQRR
jgi:thiamine biosynthesis lipoprotein